MSNERVQNTYIVVVCLTKRVLFVGLSIHHISQANSETRIHRIIGHKLILEAEVGIHAYYESVEKSEKK